MPNTGIMKNIVGASLALLTTVNAHSWLECTDYDNSEILPWMKGNSTLNPPVIIDPGMPWYAQYCKAYPRALEAGGNWIEQSSRYTWNVASQSFNMGPSKPADTHACPPEQRTPYYLPGAPMKKAAPGDTMKLFYGGNGHTRGYNAGGNVNPNPGGPGSVSVYWKGAPEQEIVDISELTSENLLQTNGFADESFSYPADPSIKSPEAGLVDKGNWQTLKLPSTMAPGRHMMVWVWRYAGSDAVQWTTCFDVLIEGSAASYSGSSDAAPAAAAAAPAYAADTPAAVVDSPAPAAAAPAAAAPEANTPAPAAPAPQVNAIVAPAAATTTTPVAEPTITPPPMVVVDPNNVVIETVWTTVDVWTTVWDSKKRRHVRQFVPQAE